MTRWNVNEPNVVGPEYFGLSEKQSTLIGSGQQVLQRFRSNSAESIGAIRLHGGITSVGYPGLYLVEMFLAGEEVMSGGGGGSATPALSSFTAVPNALAIIAGTINNGTTGGVPSPTAIDEWPPNYTDVVAMGVNAALDLQFLTAAFSSPGRISTVSVELVTDWGHSPLATATDPVRRTVVSVNNTGTLYGSQTVSIPNNNNAGTAGRVMVHWGEINPVTNRPWTVADIRAFDTATNQIRLARQSKDGGQWRITAARLIVTYEPTERRQAVGVMSIGTPAGGLVPAVISNPLPDWTGDIVLRAPDATLGWAKGDSVDYVLGIRGADRGGLTGIVYSYFNITSTQAAAGTTSPPDLANYSATMILSAPLTDGGLKAQGYIPVSTTPNVGKLTPFVLRTAGSTTSADGQPYTQVRTVSVFDGGGASQQELTPSTTEDYAGLRMMLAWGSAIPTDDLVVTVRRRSDDVVIGTPFTFTTDDAASAGVAITSSSVFGTASVQSTPVLVLVDTTAPAPGVTLVGGTQYYLDFTSLTLFSAPWLIGLLAVNSQSGGVAYEEATYNGAIDKADPIAGVAATALGFTPADFSVLVDSAVDRPANFTADPTYVPIDDPPEGCAALGLPYIAVRWDVTSLGTEFAYYEVQRLDPVLGWVVIGLIDDESVTMFPDHEARIEVTETYRMRVTRTDGAFSYWTADATATTDSAGSVLVFTSNHEPDMGVAYADVYEGTAERTYAFPEAGEVQVRTMFDRDYQVAFHPLSRRGITFDRTLLIAVIAAPVAGVGPPAADALRDLAWTDVPYVCVRDSDGNRWFGTITVPDLAVQQPAEMHRVTLTFIQTTNIPAASDAEPTTPPPPPTGDFTFVGGDPFLLVGGTPLELV